ncbi:MAG: SDR family oxidoreductase [Pseudomonadota bacterium]
MKTFHQRVVAITGAASGIGQALAVELSKRGAKLALSDVLDLADTRALCESASSSIEVLTHSVNVGDQHAVATWAKDVFEHYGAVHAIINNAGIALSVNVEDMSYEDIERIMTVNFWGVVYGTKEFLPYLRQSNDAHIMNVSSLFGLAGVPNQTAYCSAKFAVRGFTQSVYLEEKVRKSHINCSYACPGGIKTNIANFAEYKEQVGKKYTKEESSAHFNNNLARTSPEKAAQIILRGMLRNRLEIIVGVDAAVLSRLIRLVPSAVRALTVRML